MIGRPPVYGLDVVADNNEDGIDPEANQIVAIGLSTVDGDELYEGPEDDILAIVDHRLTMLDPGVVTTWNGSLVDLPLLQTRSERTGISLGIRLRTDSRRAPQSPVDGVIQPVCGRWYSHRHLDLRRVYEIHRWFRRTINPESLVPPIDDLAKRDPSKNAHLARCLAVKRWPKAKRSIDRMPNQKTVKP